MGDHLLSRSSSTRGIAVRKRILMRRAVFLDRDGVINSYVYNADLGTVDSPSNEAEFKLLPGVGEAIAELNRTGLLVFIVSNQPGIATGKF